MTIEEMQAAIHENAVNHGFWDKPIPFPEFIALAHAELSEALEEARKGHRMHEIFHRHDGGIDGVAVELADCIIRILDYAECAGIDMEKVIIEKMAFNLTRPRKHGKEF